MTSQANKDNSETAEINPPRPGQRLHAARAAAEFDLSKLAAQMHLSEATLLAIEADDYDKLPTRVFVRGYYRNYARLLGLSENEILADLDMAWPEEGEDLSIRPVGSQIKPEVRSSHSLVRLVTWLIVLGSVALFVVWWVGYLQWQDQPATIGEAPPQEAQPAEDNLLNLPLPAPETEPVHVDVDASPAGEGSGAATEVAPPADEAVSATAAEQVLQAASEAPAQEAPTPVVSEPAPAPQPVAASQFVVSFNDDCWTDIRDSSGSFRLFGLMQAGTRRTLGGQPPYRILFGNSGAAAITIDGKSYDHSIHARANVARFTLGLDDLTAE